MNYKDFRSTVFSILKTGFGWVGYYPDGMNPRADEDDIQAGFDAGMAALDVAQALADRLHAAGGEKMWGRRIDGKPNRYHAKGATPHERKITRNRKTNAQLEAQGMEKCAEVLAHEIARHRRRHAFFAGERDVHFAEIEAACIRALEEAHAAMFPQYAALLGGVPF